MRVRALVAVLLAVCAFLALYAVGQASEDDGGDATELTAPEALDADVDATAAPPPLESGGPLPGLKPRQAAPSPAPAPVTAAPAPVAPAPAPVAPAPTPAPAPAPPSDVGQPFYDDR